MRSTTTALLSVFGGLAFILQSSATESTKCQHEKCDTRCAIDYSPLCSYECNDVHNVRHVTKDPRMVDCIDDSGKCTKCQQIECKCCPGWKYINKYHNPTLAECKKPKCDPPCRGNNEENCIGPNECNCSADDQFYGKHNQCSLVCPPIPNCSTVNLKCTSKEDVTCKVCDYHVSTAAAAYKLSTDSKTCNTRCSWRGNWCWPGKCTGTQDSPDKCTCLDGFSGEPRCLKITSPVEVEAMIVTIHDSRMSTNFFPYQSVTDSSTQRVFTKLVPVKATLYDGVFKFGLKKSKNNSQPKNKPHLTDYLNYKKATWIDSYEVGVTDVQVEIKMVAAGVENTLLKSSPMNCTYQVSRDNPTSSLECSFVFDTRRYKFQDGNQLQITVFLTNGGFIKIIDMTSNTRTTYYYTGYKSTLTTHFIFDRVAPVHCSVDSRVVCPQSVNMLSLGRDVTNNSQITVTWNGWSDPGGSGVKEYTLQLFGMVTKSPGLLGENETFIINKKTNASEFTVVLNHFGLYSVVLRVCDKTDNCRIARRLLLFARNSSISIDSVRHPITFPQSTRGERKWLRVANGEILLNWTGHFYNTFLRSKSLLSKVSGYLHGSKETNVTINPIYDQPDSLISLNGTVNHNGIVSYRYAITYAGDSKEPHNSDYQHIRLNSTGLTLREIAVFRTSTKDGDDITIWLQAEDIFGHRLDDNATVFIDSSQPSISNLQMETDGEKGVHFLSTTDFSKMTVKFDMNDPHSGITSASSWCLGETEGGQEMGCTEITVRKPQMMQCYPENCTCTSLSICYVFSYTIPETGSNFKSTGEHGRSYYLTVNATNEAQLWSSSQLTITIDTTPPQLGIVNDGVPGQTDVDYQQGMILNGYWEGFTDPDSGIHHYNYAIANSCLTIDQLQSSQREGIVIHRTNPKDSWTQGIIVAVPGTYYVTVVAYNNAIYPVVSCSDGVTIDPTPPKLEQIEIQNIVSIEGLVRQKRERTLWLVDAKRRRRQVSGYDTVCFRNATEVQDVSVYPVFPGNGKTAPHGFNTSVCPFPPSSTVFFTHVDNRLVASWEGQDQQSGIEDFFVGIASTASENPPSVFPFTSTTQLSNISVKIPRLAEGQQHFVIVKAINRAGLETTKAVGPIVLDTSPPHFDGYLTVNRKPGAQAVTVHWRHSDAGDNIGPSSYLQYKLGAGTSPMRDNLLRLTPINVTNYPTCSLSDVCTSLDWSLLQPKLHGNENIFFILRVTNRVNLSVTAVSKPYHYVGTPPTVGAVFELPPSDEDVNLPDPLPSRLDDIDFQTSTSSIRFRWTGFNHPFGKVYIYCGVGTSPGSDNVAHFRSTNSKDRSYEFSGLQLTTNNSYYVTVLANNSVGTVNASSDGVRVLSAAVTGMVYDRLDCSFSSIVDVLNEAKWKVSGDPSCEKKTGGYFYINRSCKFSVTLQTTPGQSYLLYLKSKWNKRPSNLSDDTVTLELGGTNVSLLAGKKINISDSTWNAFSLPFRAISSLQSTTIITKGNGLLIIQDISLRASSNDIDYRVTVESVSATWKFDSLFLPFITHYLWAVFANDSSGLVAITAYKDVGNTTAGCQSEVNLRPAARYIVGVKACNPSVCFSPVFSDGFRVQAIPPIPTPITADIIAIETLSDNLKVKLTNGTAVNITLQWEPFRTLMPLGTSPLVEFYEWTVVSCDSTDPLFSWQPVLVETDPAKKNFKVTKVAVLDVTKGKSLAAVVRGYNQAGLHSDSTAAVLMPSGSGQSVLPAVYDILPSTISPRLDEVGRLIQPTANKDDEIDYTNLTDSLAAGWPWTKQGTWEWAVLEQKSSWNSCSGSVPSIACGTTPNSSHAVTGIRLQLGVIYYFCIHLLEIAGAQGDDNKLVGAVICSDGVKVDKTPPEAGKVYVGLGNYGSSYQTFVNAVFVRWTGFIDVEEYEDKFRTGIKEYSVAVGTSLAGIDVVDYIDVGSSSQWLVTNVSLRNGVSYYATVKAVDHVGYETKISSRPVTIDTTPPVAGSVHVVDGKTGYINGPLKGFWTEFRDPESGIEMYEWCVGSHPGHSDDAIACKETKIREFTESSLILHEGQAYFLTVRASNGAGLSSIATTSGFVYDVTPPISGSVLDGLETQGSDNDYQTSLTSLSCQWRGFVDPHSSIIQYSVGLGTKHGRDDITSFANIGLLTNYTVDRLSLAPGSPYYCTVIACNQALLCASSSSDGIVPDNSAPVVGIVHDGTLDGDTDFSASRDVIGAKWFGFHDPQSSIDHYKWCAGTVQMDDIYPWTDVYTEEVAVASLSPNSTTLPEGLRIYSYVKAYNRAGLWAVSSSDGFVMDTTKPVLVTPPAFVVDGRSIKSGTQYSRSVLEGAWEFRDNESLVVRHVVAVFTHHNSSYSAAKPVELGSERSGGFVNVELADGERYYLTVTACNAAKLCSTSSSLEPLLVDGSPPLAGSFVDDIQWHSHNSSTTLQIRFLDFSDGHSGILSYLLSVGSTYSGVEYTIPPYIEFPHRGYQEDEQNVTVTIRKSLVNEDRLYLSLYAINGVGLRSRQVQIIARVQSTSDSSGSLMIQKYGCQVPSCLGQCTCGPAGLQCDNDHSQCPPEVETVPPNSTVIVFNTLTGTNVKSTSSNSSLQGSWRQKSLSPFWPVHHYQVAMGSDKSRPESSDWMELGQINNTVIVPRNQQELIHKLHYAIYVKAWWSNSSYTIFKSTGVTVDITPPSTIPKQAVMDVVPWIEGDADFTNSSSELQLSWNGSFTEQESDIIYYEFAYGSRKEGDDVVSIRRVLSNVSFSYETGLKLSPGTRYYGTVRAINSAGLSKTAFTDGIVVDREAPLVGVVLDGDQLDDIQYQYNTSALSAHWHGFFDRHSFLDRYLFGIGDYPESWDVVGLRNVGLRLRWKMTGLNLDSGRRYFVTVVAVDAAGLRSPPISSDGVTVDTSPPVVISCRDFSDSILGNRTFSSERNTTHTLTKGDSIGSWFIFNGQAKLLATASQNAVLLSGGMRHHLTVLSNVTYEVVVTARRSGLLQSQQLLVSILDTQQIVTLKTSSNSYRLYVVPKSTKNTSISISAVNAVNEAVIVEAVAINMCLRHQSISDPSGVLVDGVTFHRHLGFLAQADTLEASWRFDDAESGFQEAMWAVGTVLGGQQLQVFKSLGRASHGINKTLAIRHGMKVYVTVVGINGAGLAIKLQPAPLIVDFTAPKMGRVVVTNNKTSKIDPNFVFLSGNIIQASWEGTEDIESAIDYCEWAIGLSPHATQLQAFTRVNGSLMKAMTKIDSQRHGVICFVTVRCQNRAGLVGEATSTGVPFSTSPPDSSLAVIPINLSPQTLYGNRGSYQSSNDSVKFSWSGFEDPVGISHYEVTVTGRSVSLNWINVTDYNTAEISNLTLTSGQTYNVSVRAVNYGGLTSTAVTEQFTVLESAPIATGHLISGNWNTDGSLTVSWDKVFDRDILLSFEVSIGSREGASNILQRFETEETHYTINAEIVKLRDDTVKAAYNVIVTAINKAGLHTTVRGIIQMTGN